MRNTLTLQRLLVVSSLALFALTACGGGGDGPDADAMNDAGTAGARTAESPVAAQGPAAEVTPAEAAGVASTTDGSAGTTTGIASVTSADPLKPDATDNMTDAVAGANGALPAPVKPSPSESNDPAATTEPDKTAAFDAIQNETPANDTSAIRGFWDFSTTEGPLDILYEAISRDGRITYFDWDNDDFGSGRDCFVVETRRFEALGDNRYSFDGTVLDMAVVGRMLVVNDGSGLVQSFPERMIIDTRLLPRCE